MPLTLTSLVGPHLDQEVHNVDRSPNVDDGSGRLRMAHEGWTESHRQPLRRHLIAVAVASDEAQVVQ